MTMGRGLGAAYTAGVLFVMVLPNLLVLPMSLTAADFLTFPPQGLSGRWYGAFFGDPKWAEPLVFSLWLSVVSASLAVTVGGLAAWPLSRRRFRGRVLAQALALSPLVVPAICLAVGSFLLWARLGLLGSPLSLVATHAMLGAPYALVVIGAGASTLDESQLRAAESLGASGLALARRIVVPLLLPSVVTAWVFCLAVSLDEVVLTRFLLRAGQSPTLSVLLFAELQYSLTPVIAVASTVYAAAAVAVAVLAARRTDKERETDVEG